MKLSSDLIDDEKNPDVIPHGKKKEKITSENLSVHYGENKFHSLSSASTFHGTDANGEIVGWTDSTVNSYVRLLRFIR